MRNNILLIVLVNLVMYFRVLRYGYLVDDDRIPKKRGRNFLHTFFLQITGQGYCNPEVEHFQRVLLHAAVCVMVYLALGADRVSLAAALLFSVHPINNQNVGWINASGYSMSNLLVLAMVDLPFLAPAFYCFTLWWHVTAFPAPLLFVWSGQYTDALKLFVPYLLIVGYKNFYVPFWKVQENAMVSVRVRCAIPARKYVHPGKLVFAVKSYAYYFFLGTVPVRLGLHHDFGIHYGTEEDEVKKWDRPTWLFWVGLGILAGSAYVVVRWWGEPVSFGVFWWNVFIVQWCNLVILHQTITERYASLATVGLMYSLAGVCSMVPYGDMALVAVFTFYAVKMSYYLPAFKDMESYVDYNLREFPENFPAWNLRGIQQRNKRNIMGAITAWHDGLRWRPRDPAMLVNLAATFLGIGDKKKGLQYCERTARALDGRGPQWNFIRREVVRLRNEAEREA